MCLENEKFATKQMKRKIMGETLETEANVYDRTLRYHQNQREFA